MSFYAYIHCKPDGTPFYVGKGDEARVSYKKRHHNNHHMNILLKYGEENILVGKSECSSEEISFELERGLIKRLRKMGVPIVNLTEGGDGTRGAVRSPEARAKMALGKIGNKWNCGREYSTETRRKKSRSLGGTPVECTKDGITLKFFSISEAARDLGLNAANITNHLKRTGEKEPLGIKGWVFERVQE
jgi:hypothetical protein